MGKEFRVNSYQSNWQSDPDVIATADGGFIIVYESYVNEYDYGPAATVVLSRRYDASGRPVGDEELVDGLDGTAATAPRATLLSDGGYAVTWLFDNYDDILTTDEKAYVRAFDADGTPRTGAIRVDDVRGGDAVAPEIYATANGGFEVVFGMERSTGRFDQLYSQRFDARGETLGGNALVNVREGEFDQFLARSAVLRDGSSVTIWNSEGTFPTEGDIDSNEIRATIAAPTGRPVHEDIHLAENYGTVDSSWGRTGMGYDVAALEDGGFVVVHKNYDFELGLDTEDASYYTVMRFFDAAGRPEGGPRIVDASDDLPGDVRAAQLDTGQIVVVWDQDDDSRGFVGDTVYGRVFSEDGRALTGRFDVGGKVPSHFDQESPEIAALPGGGFVVTWTSEYVDRDDDGVAARIFGRGTARNDALRVDASGTLAGLGGDDLLGGDRRGNVLDGGRGADELRGGGGADLLLGGAGRDALLGGGGADALRGGGGADTLGGGGGRDRLAGGGGSDLFVFARGDGADRIADFTGRDTIGIDGDLVGLELPRSVIGLAREAGGDVVLRFGGGDVLTIEDAEIADLRGSIDIL